MTNRDIADVLAEIWFTQVSAMSYTADDFAPGTRVHTPHGNGSVAYIRMAPPSYATVEAVSVVLDGRRDRPGYSGTMYAVDDVRIIKGEK